MKKKLIYGYVRFNQIQLFSIPEQPMRIHQVETKTSPAQQRESIYRALAMLGEVVLPAVNPEILYLRVCQFLIEQDAFVAASVRTPNHPFANSFINCVDERKSGAGKSATRIATESAKHHQDHLVMKACINQQPCIGGLNSIPSASKVDETAFDTFDTSVLALPVLKNGATVAVLLIESSFAGCFDDALVQTLQTVTRSIADKLTQFDTEAAHANSVRMTIRVQNMFAALSATNEAILRTKAPEELYQRVCDAAVHSGKFTTTLILKPNLETGWMETQAMSGTGEELMRDYRMSIDPSTPEGQGTVGVAYRSGRACLRNHMVSDPRMTPWRERAIKAGIAAVAAVPMLRNGQSIGVILFHSKEGNAFDEETVKLLESMAENVIFALDNFEREAERRSNEERIKHLATHDGLTGLPNRVMFSHLLGVTLETAKRYHRRFALLFIDLDRFKFINDTLGHDAGDALLKEISARFRQTLRASDAIARLGGDEFVLLIQEMNQPDQAVIVAQKILAAAAEPIILAGQACRISASVGIALFPEDGEDESALTKNADVAMYHAKQEGKNNYQFFSQNIKTHSTRRAALEANLRTAIERNELLLHYQPKVDLLTDSIIGVEALLRWKSPVLGDVMPADFLAVAEETGLIIPIGLWTLRQACLHNMEWQRKGIAPIRVAVNLSSRQLSDDGLLRSISEILAETGMPADLLELEVTESMVIHHQELAIKLLSAIKQMGIRVAIDDFGTSYSLLRLLPQFPIDTLKIDRSFMDDLEGQSHHQAIAESMIAIGKTLSNAVVAKGVETVVQRNFLKDHGCDQMQGFYFSKGLPADEFARLMHRAKF